MSFNFEPFRNEDGDIELIKALETFIHPKSDNFQKACDYIKLVCGLQPIKSRQVAAVVLGTAISMVSEPAVQMNIQSATFS